MLPKEHRLTTKDNFGVIFKKGFKSRGKYGMLISLSQKEYFKAIRNMAVTSTEPKIRIGFVVSTKVGNAVQRHRFKRQLRAVFSEFINENKLADSPSVLTYIAFARPEDFKHLKTEFSAQLRRNLMSKSK